MSSLLEDAALVKATTWMPAKPHSPHTGEKKNTDCLIFTTFTTFGTSDSAITHEVLSLL